MKTIILKKKNYKIFLLFLLFTSLSSFSQDYGGVSAINNYVTSKEKERGEIVMFNTNGVGKWPVIKNAKCNKNTQACFYEEFKRLVLKEIFASVRKDVSLSFKGYIKFRLNFIVEKNGKIKHVWFDNKNFKNDKFYKELERVIKKIPIIDGAKIKPRPKSKSKDIRLFRSYPLTLYGSESTKNKKIEPEKIKKIEPKVDDDETKVIDGEVKKYHSNGKVKEITNYVNRVKEGEYILYWPNGKLATKGTYRNGEKTGIWKKYYNNEAIYEEHDIERGDRKQYDSKGNLTSHKQSKYIIKNTIIHDGIRTTYNAKGEITGKTEIFALTKTYTYNKHINDKRWTEKQIYAFVKDTIVWIDPSDYNPKEISKLTNPTIKNGLIKLQKNFYHRKPSIRVDIDKKGEVSSIYNFDERDGIKLAREGKYEEAMPHFLRSLTCGVSSSNEYYASCLFELNKRASNRLKTIEKDTKEYDEINRYIQENLKNAQTLLEFFFKFYEDRTSENALRMMDYVYTELKIDNDLSKKVKSKI